MLVLVVLCDMYMCLRGIFCLRHQGGGWYSRCLCNTHS